MGFPSPADDFLERNLDLNTLLIQHPAATFFLRVQGNAMIQNGVKSGDIVIVDRSIQNVHNKLAIVIMNGELTLKKLTTPLLHQYPEMEIWGVVTFIIHATYDHQA